MNWFKAFIAALCTLAATNAHAETWRHAQSGISLEVPADLRLGRVTDARNDGTDVSVQLGSGRTVATFFVFRPAYPNVAMWYERARSAMSRSFGLSAAATPRLFALPGTAGTNGMREELDVSQTPSQQFPDARATAVALAGQGEWMIKVRITSATIDRAQITRVLDSILAGVRVSNAAAQAHPMTLPEACPAAVAFNGRAASGSGGNAAGPESLQAINAAVRGQSGLAADPGSWCRLRTALPEAAVSVFARRDGTGWVALVGDFGAAITGMRTGAPGTAAVLYGSTSSGNRLLSTYDDLPAPASEVERHFQSTLAIRGNAT